VGEHVESFGGFSDADPDNRNSMLRSHYNLRRLNRTQAGLVASNPYTCEVAIHGRPEGTITGTVPIGNYFPGYPKELKILEDGGVEASVVLGDVISFYDSSLFIQFTSGVRPEPGEKVMGVLLDEGLSLVGEVRLSSRTQPWEIANSYQNAVRIEKNAYLLADTWFENRIDIFTLSEE
jgi:hypothetical protein